MYGEEEPRIKCGKCKGKHVTVNEVRNCYLGTNLPTVGDHRRLRNEDESGATLFPSSTTQVGPSGAEFLKDDPRERGEKESGQARYRRLAESLPNLKRSYYAVERDGTLKFYQVDKPQEGRWFGYTFIKVQASDEFYPVKDVTERTFVIEAIAEDPEAAMLRYGREIGKCGHCGRTLTNEESREFGIGPVCRGKMGW